MRPVVLEDPREIEAFLRREVDLHVYAIGDLDPFFRPYTKWYGLLDGDELRAVALLYSGLSVPSLLALSSDPSPISALLTQVHERLPARFYAHLSPGVEEVLRQGYTLDAHGPHLRMTLADVDAVTAADEGDATRLRVEELDEIRALYDRSYPGHWFDARMLQTGQYFGIRVAGRLVSVAGIHVYAPDRGVAALGNIVTDPGHRRRGYGAAVTARLCRSLLQDVDHVGLNVHAENVAAIRCYERLGFVTTGSFGEFMVTRKPVS